MSDLPYAWPFEHLTPKLAAKVDELIGSTPSSGSVTIHIVNGKPAKTELNATERVED